MATRSRFSYSLIISLVIIGFLVFLFFYVKHQFTTVRTEVKEDVMVQKIITMGKLELVKYAMKDVIEKKNKRTLLPDERVLFVAVGEVTACIDLTRVKEQDIATNATHDTVTVNLPKAEICYVRLDHQRSKVYEVTGTIFPGNTRDMVEDIYKLAEKRLLENAREMNITGKAQENAQTILKPLLEGVSGKVVVLKFK
ncbi:DUF4230 domain-containing protein [Mucilaginibacter sp. RS28]|uniref:DUF4230 domain-containing protein n=1 Tax=Mucilaginibacter straminoryzae TaxID=2932774 RepID=A0A9X1X013_9SPHI|nr:DUF4230 domain-containing protein [Mucilaginibacter straminoryzae]MCJ8208767.1 DUF4230 domain-containing protein [Mucilaginibacter straminoryzae]